MEQTNNSVFIKTIIIIINFNFNLNLVAAATAVNSITIVN
jgi:hypothetical protein